MVEFNAGLELRSGLLPTVWDSSQMRNDIFTEIGARLKAYFSLNTKSKCDFYQR